MFLKTFVEPPLENNNYLLIDEVSGEAALIDCSHYDPKVLELLKEQSATLKYILLTHAHFDHILGVEKLVEETGAKVVLHSADEKLLGDLNSYTFMLGMPAVKIPTTDIVVNDSDVISLGKTEIKIIHTPGHTLGGVGYYVDGKLFSGDTLFRESVGRTDLEGGSFRELENSIKTKFFVLPDDTIVYPGHGASSTIGHEKEFNSYV